MKRLFSILLVLLSLHGSWFVASAQAQAISNEERFAQAHNDMARIADVGELVRLATRHHDEGDWVRAAVAWERASSLRPFNANFLYELAANSAQYGNLPRAFEALLVLQTRGHGFDLEADRRLVNLHGTPLWQHLVELNKTALESAFGEGERVHELPPADLLLESIAWDTRSKKLLLGSARDGTIYRLDKDGTLEPWSQPQGEQWWSIFDVKVDAPRNLVWATTSAVPHFKGFKPELAGKAALLKIDLRNGRLLAAYPAPDDGLPHILNGIAVSRSGQVVVAEGMRGQLFIMQGDALAPLMAERQLNALRGLTFSADDKVLYFSDYERGLFGLDLNARSAFDLSAPRNVSLAGIEGLYLYDGQLIAIQNGMRPQRVMRFKLDDSGRAIEMGVPIEANRPEFATPTLGTLADDGFYFIANSQRGHYDGYGLLKGGVESLPPVRIIRSDPRFNWDFQPPTMPGISPSVPD